MSQWTHVHGCIRFDCLRRLGVSDKRFKKIIENLLGKIVQFDDVSYETTLPCGSEGSLQYAIWQNPNVSHIAAYNVQVFGDLRDYGEAEVHLIEKWIRDIIVNSKDVISIRDLCIGVNVEYGDYHLFFLQDTGKEDHLRHLAVKRPEIEEIY